jgi:acyl carrier protein
VSIKGDIAQFIVTSFAPDVDVHRLASDLDLLDSGVVDSLSLLRLIDWVGDKYDIPVAAMNISPAQFSSVNAIASFIREAHSATNPV